MYAWLSEPMAPPAFTVAVAACDRASLWQEAGDGRWIYSHHWVKGLVQWSSCVGLDVFESPGSLEIDYDGWSVAKHFW